MTVSGTPSLGIGCTEKPVPPSSDNFSSCVSRLKRSSTRCSSGAPGFLYTSTSCPKVTPFTTFVLMRVVASLYNGAPCLKTKPQADNVKVTKIKNRMARMEWKSKTFKVENKSLTEY